MKPALFLFFLTIIFISCTSDVSSIINNSQLTNDTVFEKSITQKLPLQLKAIVDILPLNGDSFFLFFKKIDSNINATISYDERQQIVFAKYELFYESAKKQVNAVDIQFNADANITIEQLGKVLNTKWQNDFTDKDFIPQAGDIFKKMEYTDSKKRKKELAIRLKLAYRKEEGHNEIAAIYIKDKLTQGKY